jgi:DNA-binding NarL/FixJ family response regulator
MVDDDSMIRTMFLARMKRYKIKKEKDDDGRPIKFRIFNRSNDLLKDIIENKSTYGLILIDENLGPDSLSGSQCIRRLRNANYKGAIVSISGSYKPSEIIDKVKQSGSNGIIPKNSTFFSEITKILKQLTTRDLK